jgi:hypothetical protein
MGNRKGLNPVFYVKNESEFVNRFLFSFNQLFKVLVNDGNDIDLTGPFNALIEPWRYIKC